MRSIITVLPSLLFCVMILPKPISISQPFWCTTRWEMSSSHQDLRLEMSSMPKSISGSVRWECVLLCNSRPEKTMQPKLSLWLVPCERMHSSAQTYHSSPLPVAPGLKAAGPCRPSARVHRIPLSAPEERRPPFVIGKHAEKLVCASHDK